MRRIKVFYIVVVKLLFFTFANAAPAYVTKPAPGFGDEILVRWRFSLMSVVSFYNNNPDYTVNTQGLFGFGAAGKAEFSLKSNKMSKIIAGMEYFNQALQFNSYYFAKGYSVRYDKQFNYKHNIRFQEIQLPILYKQCFNDEDDKFYSVYIMAGWACRYVFTANTAIADALTGAPIWEGTSNLEIEHPLFYKKLSASLLLGSGFERKMGNYNRAIFFEACYHYNLFRLHYSGNESSNNVFFKNSFLTLGVGYKF